MSLSKKREKVYAISSNTMHRKRINNKWHYRLTGQSNYRFSADIIGYEDIEVDELVEKGINKEYFKTNNKEHHYDEEQD